MMTPRLLDRLKRLEARSSVQVEPPSPSLWSALFCGMAVALGGYPVNERTDSLFDGLARGLGYAHPADMDQEMQSRPEAWEARCNEGFDALMRAVGVEITTAGADEVFQGYVRILDMLTGAKASGRMRLDVEELGRPLEAWMRSCGYPPEAMRAEAGA